MAGNPWDHPEWHGFHRETALSASLICAGVNALGRATHANLGEYSVALFGVSSGIERLGKLIWVIDFWLDHHRSPSDSELRHLGHKLERITHAARVVEAKRDLSLRYPFPDDPMTANVLGALTMFADASRGRYANFATIGGTHSPHDPITNWWQTVVEPILNSHFRGTKREIRAEANASLVEKMIGEMSSVAHLNEVGQSIRTVKGASMRAAENEMAQRYGRFYTLRLVRWLSDVFTAMTSPTTDPTLFGHHELLSTFRARDNFLLTRKRWPLS